MATMREVAEAVAARTGAPYERVLVATEQELVALGYDAPEGGIAPDFRFDSAHLDVVVAGVEAQLGVPQEPVDVDPAESTDDM